jgi:hypothetical protein
MDTEDQEEEMPWETAARVAIESAVQDIEKDEECGVIRLTRDPGEGYSDEEFSSFEDLRYRLVEIGESEWNNTVHCDGGPVCEADVDTWVDAALEEIGAEEFFDRHK